MIVTLLFMAWVALIAYVVNDLSRRREIRKDRSFDRFAQIWTALVLIPVVPIPGLYYLIFVRKDLNEEERVHYNNDVNDEEFDRKIFGWNAGDSVNEDENSIDFVKNESDHNDDVNVRENVSTEENDVVDGQSVESLNDESIVETSKNFKNENLLKEANSSENTRDEKNKLSDTHKVISHETEDEYVNDDLRKIRENRKAV